MLDIHLNDSSTIDTSEAPPYIIGVLMVVFLLYFCSCSIIRLGNAMSTPGQLAKIEQLREDVQKVNAGENEDIIGQVAQTNQQIAQCKTYRRLWWSKFSVPPKWTSVQTIEIPNQKEEK